MKNFFLNLNKYVDKNTIHYLGFGFGCLLSLISLLPLTILFKKTATFFPQYLDLVVAFTFTFVCLILGTGMLVLNGVILFILLYEKSKKAELNNS